MKEKENKKMLVGKSGGGGGSILKRTSSMSGMNMELGNTETNHEASPSDNNSIDTSVPHFLRTCRLCRRRLVAGRDIYMYKGDTAFCSLECMEVEMKEDEKKDKKWKINNKVTSSSKKKQQDPPPSSAAAKTHTTQLAAA